MSLSSTDKGLLTTENCAVIFIDHQPQMFFGVANIDRQDLLNNVLVLAKAVKIFHVPVILTAIESEGFSGNITPQLLDLFPNQKPIERSNLNSWENKELVAAADLACFLSISGRLPGRLRQTLQTIELAASPENNQSLWSAIRRRL